jgi:hypothetical protein
MLLAATLMKLRRADYGILFSTYAGVVVNKVSEQQCLALGPQSDQNQIKPARFKAGLEVDPQLAHAAPFIRSIAGC